MADGLVLITIVTCFGLVIRNDLTNGTAADTSHLAPVPTTFDTPTSSAVRSASITNTVRFVTALTVDGPDLGIATPLLSGANGTFKFFQQHLLQGNLP